MQRTPGLEHAAGHPSSPTQIGEGIRLARRGSARIFVERIHHTCGVDKRSPGVDGRGDPRVSAISSLVAPRLIAASVCTVVQPSQRKVTATARAMSSRNLRAKQIRLLAECTPAKITAP